MKNFKSRLKKGETLFGSWLNLGSSLTAEIVGLSGFDWVLLDLEHGSGTENELLHQLSALEHTQAAPIVRVESYKRQRIQRVLDMGAEGVMCPRINNLSEAKKAVQGMYYPPHGKRGVAKMVRATGFGKNFSDYLTNSKENILGVVQIETAEILDHLDKIAELDGIDVLFIGPSDLSMELGIFGQSDHKLFQDALRETVNAANKAGKATGILINDPDDFKIYYDLGFRMIACGADATFVAKGAQITVNRLRNQLKNYTNKF